MISKTLYQIDFERINSLLEGFNKTTGFVTAILDLEGNVLSKSGWRRICTDFHRVNTETSKKCLISDTVLADELKAGEKYHFYKCLNGLVDVAVPVIINGEHIANLFTGQFFLGEPDRARFIKQAEEHRFDSGEYMEALSEVPVFTEEQVKPALDFLLNMTEMIAEMTMQRIEQHRLTEALKESEERVRLSTEISNVAIWEFDFTSNSMTRSANHDQLYGLEPQEKWEYETFLNATHPDDREYSNAIIQRAADPGGPDLYQYDFRVVYPDNSIHWLAVTGSVVSRNEVGRALVVRGTLIDITNRKQTEDDLRTSRERLDFALNQSQTGGWDLDLLDHTAYRTLKHDQIFGYHSLLPEWTYEMFLQHIVPEDREEVNRLFQEAIRNKTVWDITCRILRQDGQIRWIWATGSHQLDGSGNIGRMAGIVQDITERKIFELDQKRLLESEKAALTEATRAKEQLSQILDRISDGFGSLDRNWNYTFVNEKLAQNVGKKQEDLLGQNIWKVFPQAIGTQVHKEYLRAMEEQIPIELEHYYPHFGRWFQHRFYPSPDGLSVFSKDITDRKLAEEKIKENSSLIRIAAEKAKLGGWNVILDENRSYWSDEVAAIHEMPSGYAPLVEDGIKFYAPEWRDRITKVFTDCAQNGIPYDEEMEILTSTGKRVWVRTIGEAVRDEYGKIFKVQGAFQDISEKKIAEEISREKDLQFRKLSANVPDLIFQFTRKPDGSYCVPVASAGIINIFGCSPEEVIDDFEPIAKVIYPDDAERVIADIEYSAKHLTYFTCEFRVQIPGKPVQWIFSRSTPEKLPDGSVTWYGFNADITQRKEIEDALRESEGKFRKIYEEGPFGMALVGRDYKFIMTNRKFCEITGYAETDLLKLTFRDISHPDDKDNSLEEVQKLIKGEIPVLKTEKRYLRKDGTVIWGAITVAANFDKDGNFLYNLTILEDITGRKNSEEKIKILNRGLQLLVEAIQELSVSTSMENIMTTVRTYARKLVNADGSTFILKEGDNCYYADEDSVSPLWKGQRFKINDCISGWAMLNRQTVIIDDIYTDERIPVEAYKPTFVKSLAIAPIRQNDPLGAIGAYWSRNHILPDMELKLLNSLADSAAKAVENVQLIEGLEIKIDERTSQLKAVNKELEAFSYSVSHDLRAPLRHINGYVDMLNNKYYDALDDQARHYLDIISGASRQMGVLIDDLLNFSRTGRKELSKTKLDINLIIKEVLNEMEPVTRGRKIRWDIQNLPEVYGDYTAVKQVWSNLLDNALKYTRKRELTMISVGYKTENKNFVFFVRDNGVGFDMKYAHKLFGVFQRLHSQSEFEGTGIGLANVQRIIQKHSGRIWAEAEKDNGAVFYFTLPATKEE